MKRKGVNALGAKRAAYQRQYNRSLREVALEKYGGKCYCCGETQYEFLGIDHLNGGGHLHRQEMKKDGLHITLWLRKHNYPEGFGVLCHNCNLARGYYGYCPHSIKT